MNESMAATFFTCRLNCAKRTGHGEMNEMTLPSRQRIRNSSPVYVYLRPITLPLGHGGSPQYKTLRVSGEETFVSLKPECQSR